MPGYEQNGLVNALSFPLALGLTAILATWILLLVRYVSARRPRYNSLLSTLLGCWGLSRWAAGIVMILGVTGRL